MDAVLRRLRGDRRAVILGQLYQGYRKPASELRRVFRYGKNYIFLNVTVTVASGAPAGLVIGVVAALILLVAAVFAILFLRHRRQAARA